MNDFFNHQPELFRKDGTVLDLVIFVGKVQRSAEGIHFILAFPDPPALEIAVVILAVALFQHFTVEGVGIGV